MRKQSLEELKLRGEVRPRTLHARRQARRDVERIFSEDKAPEKLRVAMGFQDVTISKPDQSAGKAIPDDITLSKQEPKIKSMLPDIAPKLPVLAKVPNLLTPLSPLRLRRDPEHTDERSRPVEREGTRTKVKAIKTPAHSIRVNVAPEKIKIKLPKIKSLAKMRPTVGLSRSLKRPKATTGLAQGPYIYKNLRRNLVVRNWKKKGLIK